MFFNQFIYGSFQIESNRGHQIVSCSEGLSSIQKRRILDIFHEIGDKKNDLDKLHYFVYHIDNEVIISIFDYQNTDNQGRTGGIRSKGVVIEKGSIKFDLQSILSKLNLDNLLEEIKNPILPFLNMESINSSKNIIHDTKYDLIFDNLFVQNRIALPLHETDFFEIIDIDFFLEHQLNVTSYTNLPEKRHNFHLFVSPFVLEFTVIGDNKLKLKIVEKIKVKEKIKQEKKIASKVKIKKKGAIKNSFENKEEVDTEVIEFNINKDDSNLVSVFFKKIISFKFFLEKMIKILQD